MQLLPETLPEVEPFNNGAWELQFLCYRVEQKKGVEKWIKWTNN